MLHFSVLGDVDVISLEKKKGKKKKKKEKLKVQTPHCSSADASTISPQVIEPQKALHWYTHGYHERGCIQIHKHRPKMIRRNWLKRQLRFFFCFGVETLPYGTPDRSLRFCIFLFVFFCFLYTPLLKSLQNRVARGNKCFNSFTITYSVRLSACLRH